MNLLAKSCFAPGLITMISDLITSAGEGEEEEDQMWLREYNIGKGHEIYRQKIDLSKYPDELTFSLLADISYTEYSAIVFALEIQLSIDRTCIEHISEHLYWASIESRSNIYRTSTEVDRQSVEHLLKIYRKSIDNLSTVRRTTVEHRSKICWKSIGHLSKADWTPIEHLSNIYRKSIEYLSNVYRAPIEDLSNTYRTSIGKLLNIYRTSIEQPLNIYRTTI